MIYEIATAGFLGMVLQMLLKARSIHAKAKQANVEFKFWSYFVDDWISHLISSLAVILFVLIIRRRIEGLSETTAHSVYEFIIGAAATVGYSGADIVSRFFSYTNNRINAAIDHKTTIADQATGNDPNTPTPATKPN